MRPWIYIGLAGVLAGVVACAESPTVNPVVVELFESQGCSSCPPAERVMEKLQESFGGNVLLLTFHVDYWDHLGWKDTFSDPRFTNRQKNYATLFQQDSIYTPEMIVQGEVGFVGSDGHRAQQEIQSQLTPARPAFTLTARGVSPGVFHIAIQLPSELATQAQQLTAILYEDAPSVKVLRGENRGETMSGNFAVRDLKDMPTLKDGRSSVTLSLPSVSDATDWGVAVLVKGSASQILAAQTTLLKIPSDS